MILFSLFSVLAQSIADSPVHALSVAVLDRGWCREGARVERVSLSRPWPQGERPVIMSDPPIGLVRFQVGQAGGTAWIRCQDRALVAARDLKPGERLDSNNVTVTSVDLASYFRTGFFRNAQELRGLQARGFVQKGQVLGKIHVQAEQLVKAGLPVSITYESPSVRITATGTAVQSGSLGELVRITNAATKKTLIARVIREGAVSLRSVEGTRSEP